MKLILHRSYPYEQAIKSFGGSSSCQVVCDGQFAILEKDVLCFAKIGDSSGEPYFCSPSTFVWKPQRLDYDPSDSEFPWLPRAAREVWHPESRKKLKEHHIFVKNKDEEDFFYVGSAHLGSYGGILGQGNMSATFTLFEKLPRDIWLQLGGYSGWLVDINHRTHWLDKNDLETFDCLLEKIPQQEFSHLSMTRYEEDSLHVNTNSQRGWLMYLREPADSGVYVDDKTSEYSNKADEVFECTCGISLELPYKQTVSVEDAMLVAREFFISGQLSNVVSWEPI